MVKQGNFFELSRWLPNCVFSPTMHVFDRRTKLLQRERAAANKEVEKFDFLKEEVSSLKLSHGSKKPTFPRWVTEWQTGCWMLRGGWKWRSTLAVEGAGSPGLADFYLVSF